MIFAQKLSKYPNFYICRKKNYKIPELYVIFARKMPGFYTEINHTTTVQPLGDSGR